MKKLSLLGAIGIVLGLGAFSVKADLRAPISQEKQLQEQTDPKLGRALQQVLQNAQQNYNLAHFQLKQAQKRWNQIRMQLYQWDIGVSGSWDRMNEYQYQMQDSQIRQLKKTQAQFIKAQHQFMKAQQQTVKAQQRLMKAQQQWNKYKKNGLLQP